MCTLYVRKFTASLARINRNIPTTARDKVKQRTKKKIKYKMKYNQQKPNRQRVREAIRERENHLLFMLTQLFFICLFGPRFDSFTKSTYDCVFFLSISLALSRSPSSSTLYSPKKKNMCLDSLSLALVLLSLLSITFISIRISLTQSLCSLGFWNEERKDRRKKMERNKRF